MREVVNGPGLNSVDFLKTICVYARGARVMTFPHEIDASRCDYESDIRVFIHGLCLPVDPDGHACGGWHVPAHDLVLGSPVMGEKWVMTGVGATAEIATYGTMLNCLEFLWNRNVRARLVICNDNKTFIDSVTEVMRRDIRSDSFHVRIQKARESFVGLEFRLVTPQENETAIGLAMSCYDRIMGKLPRIRTKV